MSSDNAASGFQLSQSASQLGACPTERRQHERYLVCRSLIAVPLLPNGKPDWSRHVEGVSIDVSRGGIGLELATSDRLPSNDLIIGVEDAAGNFRFNGVSICRTRPADRDRLTAGALFGGIAHDLLRPQNLTPKFDPNTLKFGWKYPAEVLQCWVDLGVLRPTVLDHVQLCPRCHAVPTFRRGCPACGSGRTTRDRLIHHFACAHVGLTKDFDSGADLICPKCRTRGLIVGADFEHLAGRHRCSDCAWTGSELEQVGHCLKCGTRFPAHEAYEFEVVGYDADRLDVLDLVALR